MVVDKNAENLKSWFRKLFKMIPARDIGVISPIRLQIQIFRTGRDRAKKKTFWNPHPERLPTITTA